jgi:hypothetical protein
MPTALLEGSGRFLRHSLLGSEAVYEVLELGDEVITAEVVHAPGLSRGMRVRLMADAAAAMERFDPAAPITATRQTARPATAR